MNDTMLNMLNISYEMMSVIVAGLFILIIIIILLYMSMKEKDTARKIAQLEHSIEDVNKEIYKIQKWITDNDKKPKDSGVKQDRELLRGIEEAKADIISLQHGLQSDREYFEDKILVLEERLRSLGHFNTPSQQRNEKQILELFQNGYTTDAIAKELRITKSEVEFTLKLSELDKVKSR
ncbi:hypothetical protein DCO58_06990 [Helicobacter saguini]|uniref:Helix-turn-helix domain-containing protein n=1 Tax=Helicobacter saguini TaxID=1548018 RepID=A0A347VN33_9HELI|nr:hypothetical protein [Helicobacter saguini]MWV61921.1 hypothetical protein [Helicobacter saguini]MWV67404.1 hypothetical protein [Helicobacter saguini]MWV69757.1 hypothetical protein [Helicobacter saguini]MWV73026.1 hypothetical protein [Helicobacter saguini]TLD95598.1 hypothetical protein LS64_001715 [Helicobacter saguini]